MTGSEINPHPSTSPPQLPDVIGNPQKIIINEAQLPALLEIFLQVGTSTAIATIVVTWIRGRKSKAIVKVQMKDGTSYEFDVEGAKDPTRLVEAIREQIRESDSGDTSAGSKVDRIFMEWMRAVRNQDSREVFRLTNILISLQNVEGIRANAFRRELYELATSITVSDTGKLMLEPKPTGRANSKRSPRRRPLSPPKPVDG